MKTPAGAGLRAGGGSCGRRDRDARSLWLRASAALDYLSMRMKPESVISMLFMRPSVQFCL